MDIYQLLEKYGGEIVSNKAMVVIDEEPVEIGGVVNNKFQLNEKGLELAGANHNSEPEKKVRARNEDGTLRGDDPSTPDINEAWENGDD